jgi:hypothetical protein
MCGGCHDALHRLFSLVPHLPQNLVTQKSISIRVDRFRTLNMETLLHYWWCYRMNRINNTFFGALRDTFRKPPF